MAKGGGAFGIRAIGRTIKADRVGGPEYIVTVLKYYNEASTFFGEVQLGNILAEYKLNKKDHFISGKTGGRGVYVTTVEKGNVKKYIVAYDMPRSTTFADTTSVPPGKLLPRMTWTGGSESMKITAETFATLGSKEDIYIWPKEKVPCAVFRDAETLQESIVVGLKNNNLVSKRVVEVVEEYFATESMQKINLDDLPSEESLQLAKYGGEVFAGVAAFRKRKVFSIAPWGTLQEFILPLNQAFAGVDSLMINTRRHRFPISSKSGKGAAASFIKNVLKVGLEHDHCLVPGTFFTELCDIQKQQTDKTKTRGIRFGFLLLNDILKLPQTKNGHLIPKFDNPVELYDDLLRGPPYRRSDHIHMLLQLITNWKGTNTKVTAPIQNTIVNNLPNSVPAFVGREIADKIMSEPKSVNQIEELIQGKKFYQFNLDLARWKKDGGVYFRVSSTTGLKFKLIYGKGSANDITLKQGFLNYFLE